MKKYFTLSNITTWLLVAGIAAMLLFPGVKAGAIRGLMAVGLFQPSVPSASGDAEGTLETAPSLLLADDHSNTMDVTDLSGHVVFINFWATWCPPCIAEMPSIQKLAASFAGNENVKFILLDADNAPAKSKAFMDKNGFDLPVFYPAGNISSAYFTGTLPTTVILNKAGKIVFKKKGTANYGSDKMVQFLKQLAEE